MTDDLTRFTEAQQNTYATALKEISAARKQTHWMWFVFPQLRSLGLSEMAHRYGIRDLEEATSYLQHIILGPRLIEITSPLLSFTDKTAHEIFGSPDDLKLQSCMTLFSNVPGTDPIFKKIIDQYYGGAADERTLKLLAAG